MSKHLVIVHSFILSGTGSNIYSCNVAMQWKRQGHAVSVFCNDPSAGSYDWVDEFYGSKDTLPTEAPKPGTIRVVVPDIAGLLPVLCYDEYKGYKAKTIPTCTKEEIDRYIRMTSECIKKANTLWHFDKVLANHAVLSPVIVKRALEGTNVPFDIKIHGSSIIFVLNTNPEFKPLAVEAINASNMVISGTQHIVDQVLKTFPELDLSKKLVIVPPGMDPDVFNLRTSIDANSQAFLKQCEKHIAVEGDGRITTSSSAKLPGHGEASSKFHSELVDLAEGYNQRVVDADIVQRFPKIAEDEPVLIYFGKFLYTKGVGEILLSFLQLIRKQPKLRLILVGFGIYREHLELMLQSLVTGNKELFKAAARCEDSLGLPFLESSINIDDYFRKLEPAEAERVLITGCLNHTELGKLLPIASIALVTSKANEAFGMVSVEALSAGVLPLCVYHSGLKDVLDKVKETEPELEKLMHISSEQGGDFGASNGAYLLKVLPDNILAALDYLYPAKGSAKDQGRNREEIGKKLRAIAEANWSWDRICNKLASL